MNESDKNMKRLRKSVHQLYSGMKLNSAGDDASAYAISEKMRVMIRSLGQDDQNVKNGKDLLSVADGGIQGIVDQLRELKALAIKAANGTNADADRATIQKEFSSRIDQIDTTASTTNYNGIYLLDGTWHAPKEYLEAYYPSGTGESTGGGV